MRDSLIRHSSTDGIYGEFGGIAHLLTQVPYQEVPKPSIDLPDRVRHADYRRSEVPDEMYVPEIY